MSLLHDTSSTTPTAEPLSVSQLNQRIRVLLQESFPLVWVRGELSDIARPQSGHVYLSLKDEESQLRAVMWRGTAAKLPFKLRDGDQVLCQGEVDAYPRRGTYQLVIRKIELAGEGAMQRALRELQQKLSAEGLFDARHKQPLPPMPQRIGLVTSPSGAALHDFLQCAARRWKQGEFWIFPVRVQGDGSAAEIAAAIGTANAMEHPPEVLVVTRGGGSVEDLWSFNDEVVVRAIHASRIPVVSAVGHEIDVTLADLVADLRALTPTEAAERVLPDVDEVRRQLDQYRQQMTRSLTVTVDQLRQRVNALSERRVLRRAWDLLDQRAHQVDELQQRSRRAISHALERQQERLGAMTAQLDALSPLAVLARGFSVTQTATDGRVVHSSDQLNVGDAMIVRFTQGSVRGRVEEVFPGTDSPKGEGT